MPVGNVGFLYGAVTFTDLLLAAINLKFYNLFTGCGALIHIDLKLQGIDKFTAVNELLGKNGFLKFLIQIHSMRNEP